VSPLPTDERVGTAAACETEHCPSPTRRTDELQEEYYRREGHEAGHFRYLLPNGKRLKDAAEIERLNKLAVPPAWTDVYLSPDSEHELQAFGRDDAGRLQYRYHPDFLAENAEAKWKRLARFAARLPQLREQTGTDLRFHGLPPRKVMALMTRLLYVAHFRVGSDEYTRQHHTYGLTTLRKRHVQVHGNTVIFDFPGKHSIAQHKAAADRTLAGNMERLLDLPGKWLFQAEEEAGICRIRSANLNGYIKEIIGPFTAKDFRTWGGTLVAAEFLADLGPPESERAARKALVECVKYVANDLGNTPTVVRAHYISPYVFDQYLSGRVLDDFDPKATRSHAHGEEKLSRSEQALKRMLEVSSPSG
jgi:DNA topoisomerase-1